MWPFTGPHRHNWVRQDVQSVSITESKEKGMIILEQCGWCSHIRTIEVYPGRRPVIREAISDEGRDKVAQPIRAVGS